MILHAQQEGCPWDTFVDAAKGSLTNETFQLEATKLGAALLQQLGQDEEGRLKPHQATGMAGHSLCGVSPPRSLHQGVVRTGFLSAFIKS